MSKYINSKTDNIVNVYRVQDLTPQQKAFGDYHTNPASIVVIMQHLAPLAMRKHTGNQDKQDFLIHDTAKRIAKRGATEVEVFEAVEWLADWHEGEYWPQMHDFNKALDRVKLPVLKHDPDKPKKDGCGVHIIQDELEFTPNGQGDPTRTWEWYNGIHPLQK